MLRDIFSKDGVTTQLAQYKDRYGADVLVILKRVDPSLAHLEAWQRYRTLTEGKLQRLLDIIQLEDEYVLVLDYVVGDNLGKIVRTDGPLDPDRAKLVMDELCFAVATLANVGLVHGNINPAEVILNYQGATLIDPVAVRLNTVREARQGVPFIGIRGFASPEFVEGAVTTPRSDVFSLGMVFGFMLTGREPTDPDFVKCLIDEEEVPFDWRVAIERSSAYDPGFRPPNALAFRRLINVWPPTPPDVGAEHHVAPTPVDAAPEVSPAAAVGATAPPVPSFANGEKDVLLAVNDDTAGDFSERIVEADITQRVAWIILVLTLVFGIAFCSAGFFDLLPQEPLWTNIIFGVVVGVLDLIFPGLIVYRALTRYGPENDVGMVVRSCWPTVVICWAVSIVLLVVVLLVT